jgi:hypothetical protein
MLGESKNKLLCVVGGRSFGDDCGRDRSLAAVRKDRDVPSPV